MATYLPETVKKYRTGQMTKARVNDQLGFAGIKDRDEWWETPLGTLGARTPHGFFDEDPLAVFLCAKYGITADKESSGRTEEVVPDDSDDGVREVVSTEELDAVRNESQSDAGSDGGLPGWWS